MSLLLDLADEQLGKHRVVLAGRPEELVPWKEWTCYKGTFSIIRLAGHGSIRYVDGREDSTFGGTFFPSLAETELRTPYMRRVCKRSKWSWRDEEAKAVWVPGEYWPLWHRDRVREQPQLVRDRLARNFTGSGAGDRAFEL